VNSNKDGICRPAGAGDFIGSGFYKDVAPDGAVLQTHLELVRSHLTPLLCKFIFSGVKPALRKTKKHPISKHVGVLKARGSRSDDLVDALCGIQRGLDEMKAGKGEPARKVLDRIRAKHKIPLPKS
jgi:gamma-glutamylcysteine synthetase